MESTFKVLFFKLSHLILVLWIKILFNYISIISWLSKMYLFTPVQKVDLDVCVLNHYKCRKILANTRDIIVSIRNLTETLRVFEEPSGL